MTRLSFVLLAEGSAKKATFRPEEDESQWWSRRDALVRCTALALWSFEGKQQQEKMVEEVTIIYPDDELTVMRVDSSLTAKISVPCERALIRAFKSAAGLQETGARPEREIECVRQAFRSSQLEKGTPAGAAAVFESFSKREVIPHIPGTPFTNGNCQASV